MSGTKTKTTRFEAKRSANGGAVLEQRPVPNGVVRESAASVGESGDSNATGALEAIDRAGGRGSRSAKTESGSKGQTAATGGLSIVPRRVAESLLWIVFPLIWLGGLVTTYDAGMAVPDWPNTYNYNMFAYPVRDWFFGPWDLFVEHGHRLLASLAGLVSIAFVAVVHRFERRAWLRKLSWGALALVILQGLLGGARVLMDERLVAQIHGTVGPGFFALCAACTVFVGRWWQNLPQSFSRKADPGLAPAVSYWRMLGRLAGLLALASYAQLALGAAIRHVTESASPAYLWAVVWAHVGTAIGIGVLACFLFGLSRLRFARGAGIRWLAAALLLLVLTQLGLGGSTWIIKYGWPWGLDQLAWTAHFVIPEKSFLQMNIVTLHVAVGSLILAASVALLVCCWRLEHLASRARQGNLESVASTASA